MSNANVGGRFSGDRVRRQLGPDRLEQMSRGVRNLLDGGVECFLVLLRRHAVAADLPHELQRGGAHLVVCRRLFWTAESLDAAAHGASIGHPKCRRPRDHRSAAEKPSLDYPWLRHLGSRECGRPLAGGMSPLIVPRPLNRTDGNLRGLTLFFAAISEPRGLYLAALAALVTLGFVTGPLAVLLLAIVLAITTFVTSIVGANLLSWRSAVLPEQDRRLVVPRLLALSLAIGALLLLPMAAALDGLYHHIGALAYALPFAVSGVLGVAEIYVIGRLRHPGRIIVPPAAGTTDALPTPELQRFLKVSATNAFGMGFAPSMSVYAITVVGVTAGF